FRNSAISVAFAATIAAYVLYGTGIALWVNTVSAVVNAFTPKRKPLRQASLNAAALAISAYLASTTYQLVGGQVPPGDVLPTIVAVAVSGLVYFLANSVLIAGVLALTTEMTFAEIYQENYSWMLVNYLATAMNGAALAIAYESLQLFGAVTFVMPLGVAWYSFRLYMLRSMEVRRRNEELTSVNATLEQASTRLEQANMSIVGALVGALEAKDPYTEGHSAATMLHAVALARKLDLPDEDIAAVQLAALFHDIGKIGIPEHILRKPGPLDEHEWAVMKDHTTMGAALLEHVPALERVRPIVMAHHERWDGKGYPLGLQGDEIPRAAQVISVADSFHAMTSTRSYRRGMSRKEAIVELRRCAGTQFNTVAVEAFIELLNEERPVRARAASADAHDDEHGSVTRSAAAAH
ncbi:MAG: HD-GYP domain-containing protein, partial [Chloroflexota bacterium]